MCGICGFVADRTVTKDTLLRMNLSLAHRGPDDHGEEIYQINADTYVGFGDRKSVV